MVTEEQVFVETPTEVSIEQYKEAVGKAVRGDTLPAIEMLLNVLDKQGNLVPLKLKPAQRKYWDERTPADIIVKAAQLGITTIVQAEYFMDAMVIPGIEILIVAQRDATATKLFEISDTFRMALPEGVRPRLNKDNTHVIEFDHGHIKPGLKSSITVGSAEAKTFGRGRPNHRLLATEVAFYDDSSIQVIGGIVARMPVGKKGEVISRRVLESTADGQAGYFYETWNQAVATKEGSLGNDAEPTDLTPHFMPWWNEPEYTLPFDESGLDPARRALKELDEHERWLKDTYSLTENQLRWRRWKKSQLGADLFKQEFPENADEAFLPIGSNVFTNTKAIDAAALSVKEPLNSDYQDTGWHFWQGPEPGRPYIISIDQASGEGDRDLNEKPLDFQILSVWDAITLTQMALYRRRDVGARELAIECSKLAVRYNDALVVPERNLAQFGFDEWLYEYGVENIYIHQMESGAYKLGYPMNPATKPALKDGFRDVLEVPGGMTIRSANLIREIRNYRWLRGSGKNRMGAPAGMNDDELVTAFFAADPMVREQARAYSGKVKAQNFDRQGTVAVSTGF